MVAESSRSRESMTLVSRSPQAGHRIGLGDPPLHHYRLWCAGIIPLDVAAGYLRTRLQLGHEGSTDLEQVADDEHVGELRDWRVGVAVDCDDRLGGLHADLVLDRAGDAEREV